MKKIMEKIMIWIWGKIHHDEADVDDDLVPIVAPLHVCFVLGEIGREKQRGPVHVHNLEKYDQDFDEIFEILSVKAPGEGRGWYPSNRTFP